MTRRTLLLLVLIILAGSGAFAFRQKPAFQGQTPSLFFMTPDGEIMPVMATDGYRLPVEVEGISITASDVTLIPTGTQDVRIASQTVVLETIATGTPNDGGTLHLVAGPTPASITADPARLGFFLASLASTSIHFSFGEETATVSQGVPLPPGGMIGGYPFGAGISIWYVASVTAPFTYVETRR